MQDLIQLLRQFRDDRDWALLTRGLKSCTVWAEDPALNAWFQERLLPHS